jgi:hypothetical protein
VKPHIQYALVGVCVVVVVLDAPGLEGVDEGRKHERPHDILQQLVLAEAAVPAVVANHEELQQTRRQNVSSSSDCNPPADLK